MHEKMSVVQQVINDARKLATRLTEHDNSVDALLSQTSGVLKKVESMKEYCEEMNELNEAANSHPRSALIQSIQQENKHIRELQKENKDMRLVLEEHQNILELIMVKHRDQIRKLVAINKKKNKLPQEKEEYERQIGIQVDKIHEMVAVMRKAAQLNENEFCEQKQLITSLSTENKGLREMLEISQKSGSLSTSPVADVATQTEEDSDDPLSREELSPELHSPNHHIGPLNGLVNNLS